MGVIRFHLKRRSGRRRRSKTEAIPRNERVDPDLLSPVLGRQTPLRRPSRMKKTVSMCAPSVWSRYCADSWQSEPSCG
jgi:hypothetical protein